MFDIEEFESWYDDLSAWERHQDELERINGKDGQIDEVFSEDLPPAGKCRIKKNG